eukprot:s22_g5.t1
MDLQNVFYRYFAEIARFFKKIQHCVRSGEAELLVIRDGEELRADDLKAASQEFRDTVQAFCSWRANERSAVEKKLEEVMQLPQWLMLAGTATGAVIMALLGLFVRHKREMRKPPGLIREWQKMGAFESTLCGFLQSLPLAVQSPSLAEALERTQATRLQLDRFLQQLQMKGLIFDPSTTSYEAGRSGP